MRYKEDGSRLSIDLDGSFVLCTKDSNDQLKANEIFVKFYTDDPSDPSKNLELKFSDYEIEQGSDCFNFKMKENVKCTLIKLYGKQLWKYYSSNNEDKYPYSVRYDHKTIVINFDCSFQLYKMDITYNIERVDIGLTIPARHFNNDISILELCGADCIITDEGNYYNFILSPNIKVAIDDVFFDESLTPDESQTSDSYLTSIRYWKDCKKILLDSDDYFVIYQKYENGDWDNGKKLDIKLYSNDSNNVIALSEKHYKMEEEIDDYVFEINEGVNCSTVKLSGKEIWTQEPEKYGEIDPKEIIYKKDKKKLSIRFKNLFFVYEKDDSDAWKLIVSKTLDISSKSSTNHFDHEGDKLFDIFSPKPEYLFGIVQLDNIVIYRSLSPYDLLSKVHVYKTQQSVIKCVDMVLTNGTIRRYVKKPNSQTWYEKLTPISLDVKTGDKGYYHQCQAKDFGTYYSKDSFGFKNVLHGASVLWESKDEINYALKVDVHEFKRLGELVLYLKSGEIKKLIFEKVRHSSTENLPQISELEESTA